MKTADRKDGGFGQAPKFPQTFSIRFLLQYYYYTGSQEALDQACLSLDKMIYGGIYDQLGGGFARYSTDSEWLAPHFEKMLYDNALLVIALSEAFQLTGKEHYRKAVWETMDFVQSELMSESGRFLFSPGCGFSEGEEGKFYTWGKNEISELLGDQSEEFCTYYDVTERGNWEGKNILRIKNPRNSVSEKQGKRSGRTNYCEARNKRIRPSLDDKILSGWNALMITACCKAFSAFGDEKYRDLAISSMSFSGEKNEGRRANFIFITAIRKSMGVWGYGSEGKATIPAFLDDYAFLIEAYIQLQEVTGEVSYLIRAKELSDWVIENFSEEETGYFYYTHKEQDDVIVRKREVYDGATASGNSVMASNLLYLGNGI